MSFDRKNDQVCERHYFRRHICTVYENSSLRKKNIKSNVIKKDPRENSNSNNNKILTDKFKFFR